MTANSPFFIVGCPRSGTTLLATLLDRHSRICIPPETHFFYFKREWELFSKGDPSSDWDAYRKINPRIDDLRFDKEKIVRLLGAGSPGPKVFFETLMADYTERAGKKRWGEKTPDHLLKLDSILGLFPESKIILITRDGRDVVDSLRRMPWVRRKSFWALAKLWKRYIRQGFKEQAGRKDCLFTLKYETLLNETRKTCREVMAFLGEDFEESQLVPSRGSETFNDWENEWKAKALKELDPSRAFAWRKTIPPGELSRWNYGLNPELAAAGYPEASSEAPGWRRAQWAAWQQVERLRTLASGLRFKLTMPFRFLKYKSLFNVSLGRIVRNFRSHPR